jgi:ClpP class serine protease
MQKRVDAFYAQFVNDVAKGRGVPVATVKADYGSGAVLLAPDALAAKMVDGIGTLDFAYKLASAPLSANRSEERDPAEADLPYRYRVEQAAEELADLAAFSSIRKSIRERAGRRPFSEETEAELRSIRDSLSALVEPVADEPSAVPEPAVPPVAVAHVVAATAAFPVRSEKERRDFWKRYVQ